MIGATLTGEEEIAAAAELLLHGEGAAAIYDVIDRVASHHGLADAWLVLQLPATGPQVFRRARWSAPAATVATLATRSPGVYTDPQIDPATSRTLAFLCEAALRTALAEARSHAASTPGLATAPLADAILARATARAARYAWTAAAVAMTTRGDAPAAARWASLTRALGTALRTGDESGMFAPGVALALLPEAGADAVRPFLARVRAALDAAGDDGIDLVAAIATTPDETVDPGELTRLAQERLAQAAGDEADRTWAGSASAVEGAAPGDLRRGAPTHHGELWDLELALREVPGVICVGSASRAAGGHGPVLTVVASELSSNLHADVARVLGSYPERASVSVHSLHGAGTVVTRDVPTPGGRGPAGHFPPGTNGDANGDGWHSDSPHPHERDPETRPGPRDVARLLSATAPGTARAPAGTGTPRVSLARAAFDAERQMTEVSLALGAARGTGRAPETSLAGSAQATLAALGALGLEVPYTLVSAERLPTVPGEPVLVVLAPRGGTPAARRGTGQRMGLAGGTDAEAASRATLSALNRSLVRHP